MFRLSFAKLAGMGAAFVLLLCACSPGIGLKTDLFPFRKSKPTEMTPSETGNRSQNPQGLRNGLNPPAPGSLPFEVIDYGASTNGGATPFVLAMRSDQSHNSTLRSLPEAARHALEIALAADQVSLYLILYAGEMPSGGFSVQIQSIAVKKEGIDDVLLVRYYVQPPDPQSGAATVLSYPYLIVSLSSDLAPQSVRFEQVSR